MGYFNKISDIPFKVNEQGDTLYFPQGLLSKGRVVPDIETKNSLTKYIKLNRAFLLFIVIPFSFLLGLTRDYEIIFLGIVLVVFSMSPFALWHYFLVRKLEKTTQKLKFRELMTKVSQTFSVWYFWLMGLNAIILILLALSFPFLINKELSDIFVLVMILFSVGLLFLLITIALYRLRNVELIEYVAAPLPSRLSFTEELATTNAESVKEQWEKEVKPQTNWLIAAPIIIIFVGLLYAYISTNILLAKISGPTFMSLSIDNELMVQIEDAIYFIDESDEVVRSIDLRDLGVHKYGEVEFFSNGDLLVYHSKYKPSAMESFRRLWRTENQDFKPALDNTGFLRCSLQLLSCENFASTLPLFSSTLRVEINRESDTVYIADSGSHSIFKISNNGENVVSSSNGLRYPNELLFQNGKLFVANTNKMQVSELSAAEPFGELIKSYSQGIGVLEFPTSILPVENNWWVGVKTNQAMTLGDILVFDSNWNPTVLAVDLPKKADVIAMKVFAGMVWVTDMNNKTIYRFGFDGSRKDNFEYGEVKQHLNRLAENQRALKQEANIIIYCAIFVFVITLGGLLILEKRSKKRN